MSKKVKIPYADTKVLPEQTKIDIERMLKAHGIRDISWTTYKGEERLEFLHEVELKGVRREIHFELRPPNIRVSKRTWNPKLNKYEIVSFPAWAQAWRLVWHYLKSKLEAIEWGLVSFEREMMAQILVPIDDKRAMTLGDIIEERIASDTLAKLPAPEGEKRIVESTAAVVK